MVVTSSIAGETVRNVQVCGPEENLLTCFEWNPDFPLDVLVVEGK
jgi:hypothetical protein